MSRKIFSFGNKSENKKQLRWRLYGGKYKNCNVLLGKYRDLTIRKIATLDKLERAIILKKA